LWAFAFRCGRQVPATSPPRVIAAIAIATVLGAETE
jgi:hypothetical protein